MEFNKETAIEVIKKYNLNPSTFRTWQNRGQIPDRYSVENYAPTGNKMYRFCEILISNKEKINFYYLKDKLQINRLLDAVNKKSTLNLLEVKKIKNYFMRLITKPPEKILHSKALHLTKVYSANTVCNFRQKLKRGTLTESDKNLIYEKLKFLTSPADSGNVVK